jgi:hypothetical protein
LACSPPIITLQLIADLETRPLVKTPGPTQSTLSANEKPQPADSNWPRHSDTIGWMRIACQMGTALAGPVWAGGGNGRPRRRHNATITSTIVSAMRRLIQTLANFLHIGQLPDALRIQLDTEGGLIWLEEGIPVTAILQCFRAPGIFCGYRRTSFVGFFASSEERLIASANFLDKVSLNLPYTDPRFDMITFGVARKRLSMRFDAKGLIPDASGQVTLRFALSDPHKFMSILERKGVGGLSGSNIPAAVQVYHSDSFTLG